MTFTIPLADTDAYARLSTQSKTELLAWLAAMQLVAQGRTLQEGCAAAATRLRGMRGGSANNVKRKYLVYRKAGDWRLLINQTLEPERRELPKDFLEHWRAMGEKNQRKWAPAHRALVRHWRLGGSVPGYGTWREWWQKSRPGQPLPAACPGALPRGWKYDNLMKYANPEAEATLARRGIAAGMEHLPTLSLDVSGLRPLELVVFDDVRTDFLVHVPEVNQVCQLWALVAMDVATRRIVRFGLRPRIAREDGSKESLLRRDMQALVVGLLREVGLPKGGMTLLVENAAAAITAGLQMALEQATGGLVKVRRTEMIAGQVFAEGYADGNRGNYKGKSWLESYFNLMHNEMAALPGQTGARYGIKPAESDGRRKEAEMLLRKGAHLPVELRHELSLPFLSLSEARVAMEDVFRRIDGRTEHAIKGFDKVVEWRLLPMEEWRPWSEVARLAPALMPHLETRQRVESPRERWERLHDPAGCVVLPEAVLPMLWLDHRVMRYDTPKNFGFVAGGQRHGFWKEGLEQRLRPGQDYLAYYDSQDVTAIALTTKEGRYVDTVPLRKGVLWGDHEALGEALAEKKRVLRGTLARVRERHEQSDEGMRQRIAGAEQNIRVFEMAAAAGEVAEPEVARMPRPGGGRRGRTPEIDVAAEILRQEAARGRALSSGEGGPEEEEDWRF